MLQALQTIQTSLGGKSSWAKQAGFIPHSLEAGATPPITPNSETAPCFPPSSSHTKLQPGLLPGVEKVLSPPTPALLARAEPPTPVLQARVDSPTPARLVMTCSRGTSTCLDHLALTSRFMLPPFLRQLYHFSPYQGEALYLLYQRCQGRAGVEEFSQTLLTTMQTLLRQVDDSKAVTARHDSPGAQSTPTQTEWDVDSQGDVEYMDRVRAALARDTGMADDSSEACASNSASSANSSRTKAHRDSEAAKAHRDSGAAKAHRDSGAAKTHRDSEAAKAHRDNKPSALHITPSAAEARNTRSGASETDMLCIACDARLRDRVMLPCAHLVMCSVCFQRVTKCPVCRSEILATVRVKH